MDEVPATEVSTPCYPSATRSLVPETVSVTSVLQKEAAGSQTIGTSGADVGSPVGTYRALPHRSTTAGRCGGPSPASPSWCQRHRPHAVRNPLFLRARRRVGRPASGSSTGRLLPRRGRCRPARHRGEATQNRRRAQPVPAPLRLSPAPSSSTRRTMASAIRRRPTGRRIRLPALQSTARSAPREAAHVRRRDRCHCETRRPLALPVSLPLPARRAHSSNAGPRVPHSAPACGRRPG
jgi:hypothetical protein